jgi:broad specificity phosphatase PhoE
MPAEIVLVRHGQCTGNVADRASYKGIHDLFNHEVRSQESSQWSLTPTGIRESELTGDWIKNNIASAFDYYFSSDYIRSVETAKYMNFANSNWLKSTLLREREWGGTENLSYPERNVLFQQLGISAKENSIFWKPPNGESMIDILRKTRSFLDRIKKIGKGKRILIVSHGAPLQAFRVLQYEIDPSHYVSFISGGNYIRNCHIFHYFAKKNGTSDIPMYSIERSVYFNPDNNWIETIQNL